MRYSSITAATFGDARVTGAIGPAIDMTSVIGASSVITVGGGPSTGSVQMQVSNDSPEGYGNHQNFTASNWAAVPSLKVSWTTTGSYVIPTVDTSYTWMRFIYTNLGESTGTITVRTKTTGY